MLCNYNNECKTGIWWKYINNQRRIFIKFIQFIMLTLIWKSLIKDGKSFDGVELSQILIYSLMASILKPQLDIVTPATSALWEGSIIGRYTRPVSVIGSLVAETIGRYWIPVFLFYGLPLWVLSPLLGINPFPASIINGVLAFISLLLSVSLGFALDLLFASFAIRLKNGCWAATRARESIYSLFSGALIPFIFFPWGLERYLPSFHLVLWEMLHWLFIQEWKVKLWK